MVVVKDERKRGLGETRAGTYRRDYRTKLQTKVIRPWRLPDVYSGLPEDYVRSVLFFSAREIMDCDRTNAPFPPPLSLPVPSFIGVLLSVRDYLTPSCPRVLVQTPSSEFSFSLRIMFSACPDTLQKIRIGHARTRLQADIGTLYDISSLRR